MVPKWEFDEDFYTFFLSLLQMLQDIISKLKIGTVPSLFS